MQSRHFFFSLISLECSSATNQHLPSCVCVWIRRCTYVSLISMTIAAEPHNTAAASSLVMRPFSRRRKGYREPLSLRAAATFRGRHCCLQHNAAGVVYFAKKKKKMQGAKLAYAVFFNFTLFFLLTFTTQFHILDRELEVIDVSLFFWDKNPNLAWSFDDAANRENQKIWLLWPNGLQLDYLYT